MCNCLNEFLDASKMENISIFLKKKYPKSKVVKFRGIKETAFQILRNETAGKKSSIVSKINTTLEVELEGKKKPVGINIVASFCPYCGEKYQDKTH